MPDVVVYGPAYSAYTRTVVLTLQEKGVGHDLAPVDFVRDRGMSDDHLTRQPFAKVPAFRHGDFELFETSAICRYIDSAFDGPALQPAEPKAIGRMAQIIAILDAYLSHPIRMGLTSQLVTGPRMGRTPDRAVVADAAAVVAHGLPVLERLMEDDRYLAGHALSLADLHTIPLFDYLTMSKEGRDLASGTPRLMAWWQNMSERPSVRTTAPDLSQFDR